MSDSQSSFTVARADVKYAVLGAGGFVGTALVERLFRAGSQVTPIVRRVGTGGAVLARFGLTQRLANVMDQESLSAAFAGAEIVFHCVTGDRSTILRGLENSLAAARSTGVRRLVYLSSAVVYGVHPKAPVDESSPFNPHGSSDYAKNKAAAEKIIAAWRGGPETVVLRPSIIYGPRSRYWSEQPARQIASGTAYLVDQGIGFMNEIHISHLVDAMLLVAHHPQAVNQIYVIQDGFHRRWCDYYHSLCELLHVDTASLAAFSLKEIARNSSRVVQFGNWARSTPGVLRSTVWHDPLKSWLKQAPAFESLRRLLATRPASPSNLKTGERRQREAIVPDLGLAFLHTYPQPLDDKKIRQQLGFTTRLSLPQTLDTLSRWYRFMGLVR